MNYLNSSLVKGKVEADIRIEVCNVAGVGV